MAIIEVTIKIACGDCISDRVMEAVRNEPFADKIAGLVAEEVDSDNVAAEVSREPMKRLV